MSKKLVCQSVGDMTVLLVAKSSIERLNIETALMAAGYGQALVSGSAGGALRRLPVYDPMGPQEVDLVLMDAAMARRSGVEACRRLRTDPRLRDVPVVLMLEGTEEGELESALAAGAADYITKPLRMDELITRVRWAIGRRAPKNG